MAPVSIRMNNPGAINIASWVEAYPGFAGAVETTPGNKTVRFETPEHGVAAWWELMRRYGLAGVATVRGIIARYCGAGRTAAANDYIRSVSKQTGLAPGDRIDLYDDARLLPFAKAMFRHEAGVATPLSDAEIIRGFKLARAHARAPGKPAGEFNQDPSYPGTPDVSEHWLLGLIRLILKVFAK
jgi:hypothetical protein